MTARQGRRRLGFPLYFNHVPKCAGTSLNELLSRSLRREQLGVEPFMGAVEVYTLSARRFDRLGFVASHVPHWVAARRFPHWARVTVLREPWSRFQALCRHLIRIQDSEPQALRASQVEFLGLLRSGRHDDAMRQSRAWYASDASMMSYFLPDPLQNGAPPGNACAQAIDVLEGYDLVLLSERLHEDSLLVDRVLNGQDFGAVARLNTSAGYGDASSGPFPDRYAKRFVEQFPYEAELYAAAERLRAASHEWLRAECDAANVGPRIVPDVEAPLFSLDWEAPTLCGGFSDRVFAASLGYVRAVARTVEAPIARLDFDLPRRGAVRVEAVVWAAPVDIQFALEVRLNRRPITLFDPARSIADPNQIWTCADVDAATIGDGRCRLEIDRRNAPNLRELWLLDFVVRAR